MFLSLPDSLSVESEGNCRYEITLKCRTIIYL